MNKEFIKTLQIDRSKNLQYFIKFFFAKFLFSFITALVANFFDPNLTKNALTDRSLYEQFFAGVLFAPVIETLVFQLLIIEVALKLKLSKSLAIVISSILFGLAHYYNIAYVLVAIVMGFIYAYYYVSLRNQGDLNKVLMVFLLHATYNLVTFLDSAYFDVFGKIFPK